MDAVDFSDRVFTAQEAADHLRISRGFLYKLIAAGKLRSVKLGTRTLFTGRELSRFVEDAAV